MSSKSNTIQVFCLPFSGGGGFSFQPLSAHYPASWKLTTLTYPGRGRRISEPLVYTLDELLEDCWQQIQQQLQPPYVLFGHSLGSKLAYLLAHKIHDQNQPLPAHLILSGIAGPSVPPKTPYRYLFSKKDFKAVLNKYGGISQEILNDEAAFDFFEPIIRADFQAVETWNYQERSPLPIPATVVTGTEEEMTEPEIQLWQKEFSQPVHFEKMQGHHFFLFKEPATFVRLIEKRLRTTTRLSYRSSDEK